MKVKLNNAHIVRLGISEPFIVPENLVLEFESVYSLDKLCVEVRQNDKKEKFITYKKVVDISDFTKQAGNIEIFVSLICNGEVVKSWELEPIVVKEVDGDFKILDFYENLLNEHIFPLKENFDNIKCDLLIVKDKTNEYIEKHNELAKTVSAIKENY